MGLRLPTTAKWGFVIMVNHIILSWCVVPSVVPGASGVVTMAVGYNIFKDIMMYLALSRRERHFNDRICSKQLAAAKTSSNCDALV